MYVTLLGMVIDSSELQYINALSPIPATLLGMITDFSASHCRNASLPISVTFNPLCSSGIVTDLADTSQ